VSFDFVLECGMYLRLPLSQACIGVFQSAVDLDAQCECMLMLVREGNQVFVSQHMPLSHSSRPCHINSKNRALARGMLEQVSEQTEAST
jgi:hypothetical protein